jgi:periplasmic copper chaperone A
VTPTIIPQRKGEEQSAVLPCLPVEMKFDANQVIARNVRRMAFTCGLALVLLAPDASALFVVNQPWLLPAARGQSTEAYMNLTSTDGARLVAVRTEEAAAITIAGQGKRASPIQSLLLPAGTVVALSPGKNHLTLTGLARSVKLGERLSLTLTIENTDGTRQDIAVIAEVRTRSPVDEERRAHHAHRP